MIAMMHQYHQAVADDLQRALGHPLEVDEGWGIKVKSLPHATYYLTKMTYNNWRLLEVLPSDPMSSSRGWCYSGDTARQALIAALSFAIIGWNGAEGTEPVGWIKSVPDGRRGPGCYGWDTQTGEHHATDA